MSNEDGSKSFQGYSGHKGEKDQSKKNEGPIPNGAYTVTNECGKAGERCNLKPDSSNNMYGRSGFQIHGDNNRGDQSASRGCIIMDQSARGSIKKGDRINVTD